MAFLKKKKTKCVDCVILGRPTKETYTILNNGSENWDERCIPDDLTGFISKYLNDFAKKRVRFFKDCTVKVITLDKMFTQWLHDNGLEYNSETIRKYSDSLSEQNNQIITQNNHFNRNIYELAMPFILSTTNNEPIDCVLKLRLDQELRNFYTDYINTQYPGYEALSSGHFVRDDVFYKNERKLLNIAKAEFDDNMQVTVREFEEQRTRTENTLVDSAILTLPFTIKKEFEKTEFKLSDLVDANMHIKYDHVTKSVDIQNKEFKRFFEKLNEYTGSQNLRCHPLPIVVTAQDIPQLQMSIIEMIGCVPM